MVLQNKTTQVKVESCKFPTFIKLYENADCKKKNTTLPKLRVKFVAGGYLGS